MDDPSHNRRHRRKELYSMRRERDVLLLYGAAFRDIPHIEDASKHIARPSSDSTLTALCQLTAIRLGAQRCMVSLLDENQQHILAEATPDTDLLVLPDSHKPALWLGNVSIPRSWGLCEQLLDMDPDEDPVLVIDDLAQDTRTCFQKDIQANSHIRFYASVGLSSPNGTVVGALCIFGSEPRNGLSESELGLLKSLATTIVGYLETYTTKDQYRRGERFTRGLVSFAEGAHSLLPFKSTHRRDTPGARPVIPNQPPLATPLHPNARRKTIQSADGSMKAAIGLEDNFGLDAVTLAHPSLPRPRAIRTESSRHQSISKLQETILPNESRSMFTRAANLMMTSSHLDGVLILDASVATNGQRCAPGGSEAGNDAPSESYHSRSSSSDDVSSTGSGSTQRRPSFSTSKICEVLGVATSTLGVRARYGSLLEPDLGRLFHEHPNGKIFTFTADGQSFSSTEEWSESTSTASENPGAEATPRRKNSRQLQRSSGAVQAMFPDARSVAFIPFWDYERSRWFAGCLCWSNDPYRLLSVSADLAYFKIFSHSIMRELSRLDAVSLNEAKTTFVASISHELRSPLHGILGTLEFIKDTPLDSFQTSMLNSLSACGTTLLDTINHVMDFSNLTGSDSKRKVSSRRLKNSNTIRMSSKPLKGSRNKDPAFDFGIATEEVVEAVFSGASYLPITSKLMEAPASPSDELPNPIALRKFCFVILDISFEDDWVYSFPVGSWRRIVMNLFGNAIKYTGSGFIHVSLRTHHPTGNTDAPTAIHLTISDSGSGMSPVFLANRAFQPFSQENTHASGTGLGLNIVRTIIDSSGGKIEISSDPAIGTKLTVKLALNRPLTHNALTPERAQYLSSLPRIEGRSVCVLHRSIRTASDGRPMSPTEEGLLRFTNALTMTLRKHLKMNVVETTDWKGHDSDLVICPELSFDYLASIRRQRTDGKNAPMTIFVAIDALEAVTLRSDTRVTNRESVVEIVTQPCGPYKLAFVLNQCLDRYGRQGENIPHDFSSDSSPELHIPTSSRLLEPTVMLESLLIIESVDAISPTPPLSGQTYSVAGSNITDRGSILYNEEDTSVSHILITDDNTLNRKLLVAFMRKNGLQYEEASNGLEALQAYQAGVRKFDVILMDMSMPIMDGMSATRAIREFERERNLPRCSIVALTGLASASAKLEAWSSGIDHFMTKPVNFKALAAVLKREDTARQERRRATGRIDVGTIQEVSDLNV